MIEFGQTLRQTREAKGLTVAQVAETTHMAPTTVGDLEREDFSRIAAPIYGRGFVKLYCEVLGLDPRPMIEEFMAIYNGNRDTGIKERGVPPSATPEPAEPVPAPAFPEAAPAAEDPELVPAEPIAEPPPVAAEPPAPAEPSLSRYAAPVHQTRDYAVAAMSYWRLGALTIAGLLVLGLLALGIRTLYRATAPAQTEEPAPAQTETPAPAAAPAPEKTPKPAEPAKPKTAAAPAPKATTRTPQRIPSLYVD